MKLVIFDSDGVLLRGNSPLPHAIETLNWLRSAGIQMALLTNNAARLPESYTELLSQSGFEIHPDEVVTSSIATAEYLKIVSPEGGNVFAIGEIGLSQPLTDKGFKVITLDNPEKCDFVVVGLDREFNYEKMRRGQHEVIINKAQLIGTNYDLVIPVEKNQVRPGGGTMVKTMEICTNQKAKIIGKPETTSIEILMKKYSTTPGETIIVGDNLDTDILAGKNAGIHTAFVLTGIHTMDDLAKLDISRTPDFILKDLSSLKECLESI